MSRLGFRNTQTMYYALYSDKTPVYDEDGYETGDYTVGYDTPIELNANIVSKNSAIAMEYFGTDLEYNKVILVDNSCEIEETTAIWIGTDSPIEDTSIAHNYKVKAINDSLNYKAIAVKKVTENEV